MPQSVALSDAPNVSRLDHLGIVAGVCDELNLVSTIDRLIPSSPKRKVSYGVAVKAMILNGLGFVQRTLYMTPTFFKNKPVSHLLGADVEAAHLHDDCLGDTLDALYDYGVSKLFFIFSYYAHTRYTIPAMSKHLDGTSLSVHGGGRSEASAAVQVVRGYNKQGRSDLAQVVLQLVSNGQSGIPMFMSVHDGHSVDKTTFCEVISAYKDQLAETSASDSGIWVADNALYTSDNINKLSKVVWLTRAGHDLKWVRSAYRKSVSKEWQAFEEESNYSYQVVLTDYGGVSQGALVILSKQKYVKDLLAFEKRLSDAHSSYQKALARLGKQSFDSEKEALKAAKKLSKSGSSYYELTHIVLSSKGHYPPGRRKADTPYARYSYAVTAEIVEKQEAVATARAGLGKFVLVTNEINRGKKGKELFKRTPEQLLHLYKNDQQKVERGFRFIKDPVFMLSHLFVQLPRRIVALAMIMCLCLLVYCLAEYKLRKSLADHEATLPNQLGKEVRNPTMRWVFLQFKGIHLQSVDDKLFVLGLTQSHIKILNHLGATTKAYYGV